jgi:hypothetical protein
MTLPSKRFGWKPWVLSVAFVLIVLATGLFAVRTFRRAVYWRLHRDEVIRPWMSIPYVAHSYRIPPKVLYEALSIDHPPHDHRPLREVAQQQKRSVDDVIAILQNAIAHERALHPPGQPPPPSPGRSP